MAQGFLLHAALGEGARVQMLHSIDDSDFAAPKLWWADYIYIIIVLVCVPTLGFAFYSMITLILEGGDAPYVEEGIVIFNGDVIRPSERQPGHYIINPAIANTTYTSPASTPPSTPPPPLPPPPPSPDSNRPYSHILDEPRGAVEMSLVVHDDAIPSIRTPHGSPQPASPQPLLPAPPSANSLGAERAPVVHAAYDANADYESTTQADNGLSRSGRHLHGLLPNSEWPVLAPFAMNFPYAELPPDSPITHRVMRGAHKSALKRQRKLRRVFEKQRGPYDGESVSMLHLPDSWLFDVNRLFFYWTFHTYFGNQTQMGTPYFHNTSNLDMDDSSSASSESHASAEDLRNREEDEHGTYTRWRTHRPYLYTCSLAEHPAYIPRNGDESEPSYIVVADKEDSGTTDHVGTADGQHGSQSAPEHEDGTTSVFVAALPAHDTEGELSENAEP